MRRTLMALVALVALPIAVAPAEAALVVRVPPALVVEHPKNTATGVIHLHNPATTAAPVYLTADDFMATSTGAQLGASVVFSGPAGASAAPSTRGACRRAAR